MKKMKLKGVSWIEANFEKLIVGIMLVVCLAVLVMQFVVVSNQVEVGGQKLPLGNAFAPAADEANRAIAAMTSDDPPLPDFEATEDLAGEYVSQLSPSASADVRLAEFGKGVSNIEQLGSEGVVLGNTFAVFTPPAPAAPVAVSYRATLNPYEIAEYEGLSTLLPPQQPYDMPWISAEIAIDQVAIEAALSSAPGGPAGEVQPLPREWWRSKQAVLAVEFEREQLQEDGSWGGAMIVESLPGFEPAIDLVASPSNWRELDMTAQQASQREDLVLRPGFYAILEGQPWQPPTTVPSFEDAERGEDQIRVLERRLANVRNQIDDRREALSQVGERGGTDDNRGGGREGGRREQPEGRDDDDQTDPRVRRIEEQIERLENEEASVIDELETLGWSESGEAAGESFDLESWLSAKREEGDPTPAWGHDIRLDQGAVYRYRARLVMANPLFGRAASLADEQKDAAAAAFVRSPWSEWSEPAETGWPEYFFVERATAGAGLGGQARPTARGELFRFHYGYWRKAVVSLKPGDRFVAEVDLPEGLQIWDIDTPAAQQAWDPAENADQPDDMQLLPDTMPVAANAWLLDVVASPFTTGQGLGGVEAVRFDAVIRGPDGLVSRRSPDQERANPLYQRISSSARAGSDQIPGIPGVGRRDRPEAPGDDRFDEGPRVPGGRDRPPPGGGGSGGGRSGVGGG